MVADQALDSKLQPVDKVSDASTSRTAAAQWQDGGAWRSAMNAMQLPNSSADQLPNFSIENTGSGNVTININDSSNISDKAAGLSSGLSSTQMKEFDTEIKAIQADLSTLSKDLTAFSNYLQNPASVPDAPVPPPSPDAPTPNPPAESTPPSSVTQPGDVSTPTQPIDTTPSPVTTQPIDSTPPPSTTPPIETTPVVPQLGETTPRTPGTPFASNSIFNLPLGTGAQWMQNDQLKNAGVYVNTVGNYNENIYTSNANDPLVTVTNDAAAGGAPSTFQVHIPAGSVPAGGNDKTFTVHDTATNTWDSFGGFNWTGDNTATVSQGSNEPFDGSGLTQDHSNWDEGVGTLTQNDLQAGTIDHMLRMELPTTMLASYDKSNTNNLAPYAYPQTQEDGFANNGNGGPVYSGTIPYGVTIGIPQGTPEPADVAANPGAHMLWQALQTHGAMVRDSGGTDNNVIFQADQNVDPNDPLIQSMNQFGAQIMASTQILANQGADSVNGGGTPVAPLDAPIS